MPPPEYDADFDYRGWDCVGRSEIRENTQTEEFDFDELVERIAVQERRREYEKACLHDGRNCDDNLALV